MEIAARITVTAIFLAESLKDDHPFVCAAIFPSNLSYARLVSFYQPIQFFDRPLGKKQFLSGFPVAQSLRKALQYLLFTLTQPVTQGVYGVEGVLKYLDEVARFWGFRVCPGLGLTMSIEKPSTSELKKIDDEAEKAAKRFYDCLTMRSDPIPSMKEVIIFRSVRAVHSIAAGFPRDHQYYKEQGWFDSDYYYETRLK